jgi:hypothetical protein
MGGILNAVKTFSRIAPPTPRPLVIRFATDEDEHAVVRLAALDSARVPRGLLVLAEELGELRAALSLTDGRAIADPFRRTAHLVDALRAATPRSARA